eukprot:14208451-Ditylum_brightwellii.AAC.1
MILLKREGTDHVKTPIYAAEDGLSKLYFEIIGNLDSNDDEYDPDVKHLLSFPDNKKINKSTATMKSTLRLSTRVASVKATTNPIKCATF